MGIFSPQYFASLFETVLARGFETPLYFFVITSNGQTMTGVLEQPGQQFKILCQHTPEPIVTFPINFFFSDRHGKPACITLEAENGIANPKWVNQLSRKLTFLQRYVLLTWISNEL